MARSVVRRSVRDNRRAVAWWLAGLAGLVGLYVAVYPTVRDQPALNRLVEQYPEVLKALIGGGATLDFTSPSGYLNGELFSFLAPLLFLVFGIGFGSGAVAGEEERGTIELLLANPLSRRRLVLEKAGALGVLLAVLSLGLWLSLVALTPLGDMDLGAARLGEAVAGVGLFSLHFGAFALLIGCATGRRGLAIGISAAAATLAYVVNALGLLVDWLEPYRKFSPYFHYFADDPLRGGLSGGHVAVLGTASLAMVALASVAFSRRDVRG